MKSEFEIKIRDSNVPKLRPVRGLNISPMFEF
jgi:hypothetical protein